MAVIGFTVKAGKQQPTEQEELARAIAFAARARRLKDEAAITSLEADQEVQRLLKERGTKRANNGEYQVTLVEAERVKIDEAKLRQRLCGEQWSVVAKTVLDKTKLEDAVANGVISADVVAECATVEKNKPFVRLSVYQEEDTSENAG